MASLTRPLIYGGLAILSIAALWATSSDVKVPGNKPIKKTTNKKSAQQDWEFPAADTLPHFDKPETPLRNVFAALVYVDKNATAVDEMELMKFPSQLAGGESGWAYTGMAEVDGVKMALLENSTSHQGGYVKEGDSWKKSRIVRITMSDIVIAGPDGAEETVLRFNANFTPKPKPLPDPGFHPMDLGPALNGPIGSNIKITPADQPVKTGVPPQMISDK